MVAYLLWQTLARRHVKISLSFMIAGHTRCLVDACFGLFKKLYRWSDTDTVAHLANVVERTASVNSANICDKHEKPVQYNKWDAFQFFCSSSGLSRGSPRCFTFQQAAVSQVCSPQGRIFPVQLWTPLSPKRTPPRLLLLWQVYHLYWNQEASLRIGSFTFGIVSGIHADFRDEMCPQPTEWLGQNLQNLSNCIGHWRVVDL